MSVRQCLILLLLEKLADYPAMIFFFDPGEDLYPELLDCLWAIEGKACVHLSTTEVAGHALRLKDWFDLSFKVHCVCR